MKSRALPPRRHFSPQAHAAWVPVEERSAAPCGRRTSPYGATHKGWRYTGATGSDFFNGLLAHLTRRLRSGLGSERSAAPCGRRIRATGSLFAILNSPFPRHPGPTCTSPKGSAPRLSSIPNIYQTKAECKPKKRELLSDITQNRARPRAAGFSPRGFSSVWNSSICGLSSRLVGTGARSHAPPEPRAEWNPDLSGARADSRASRIPRLPGRFWWHASPTTTLRTG